MKIFSKKNFLLGILIGLILLVVYFRSFPDGRLHLVFCNVGQGDAIYIRTPSGKDLLIDGGPDKKVLSCLGKYMPFYDRTIDVVILSHPNADHYLGLVSVLERFQIGNFIISTVGEESLSYRKFIDAIRKKGVIPKNLYTDDSFSIGNTRFDILWPSRSWLALQTTYSINDLGNLGGLSVLGISANTDLNNFSYYLHLRFGNFDALFTGDGDSRIQPEILSEVGLPDVEILKLPHHGSKYAVTDDFLTKVSPELAVISVGKNLWGHPTKETIRQLEERGIKILRTDEKGDIEIVSDGKTWWVK